MLAPASFLTFGKVNDGPRTNFFFFGGGEEGFKSQPYLYQISGPPPFGRPKPGKSGAPKGGAQKGGAQRVGPRRVGPRNFALFFSLPPEISFFLLSGGFLVELWWCLKRRGPEMCTFGVLGLSCASPGGPVWGSRWRSCGPCCEGGAAAT